MISTPYLFAGLILLFLLILVGIMLGTLGQGTSPLPSSRRATQSIISQLSQHGGDILELGAGCGTLAIAVARHCPARRVIAYERSFLPWLAGWLLVRLSRQPNIKWHRGNFLHQQLPDAQDWLCYLDPGQMRRIAELIKHTKPPSQLISNTFRLPGYSPEQVIRLADIYQTPIYRYRLTRFSCSTDD